MFSSKTWLPASTGEFRSQATAFDAYPAIIRKYQLEWLDYAVMAKQFAETPGQVEAKQRYSPAPSHTTRFWLLGCESLKSRHDGAFSPIRKFPDEAREFFLLSVFFFRFPPIFPVFSHGGFFIFPRLCLNPHGVNKAREQMAESRKSTGRPTPSPLSSALQPSRLSLQPFIRSFL
jgi:hypothetical protein